MEGKKARYWLTELNKKENLEQDLLRFVDLDKIERDIQNR
jgi:hypothetical protein